MSLYFRHRRAWAPRLWPLMLACVAIVLPVTLLVNLTTLEVVALSFGVGNGLAFGRWELWKHRHPIITPEEYIDDMRHAARWN